MKSNVIGRDVRVRHNGKTYIGNVIDASPDDHAKRVRIQTKGQMQGEVLMPADYVLIEFL